jgi:hypothetical protein
VVELGFGVGLTATGVIPDPRRARARVGADGECKGLKHDEVDDAVCENSV